MTATLTLSPELRNVLRAVYEYWVRSEIPPADRKVCYSWVLPIYERFFGGTFHQSCLAELATLGLLARGDDARGGSRRYYTMPDPQAVYEIVTRPV
jgi:hypothetical protein